MGFFEDLLEGVIGFGQGYANPNAASEMRKQRLREESRAAFAEQLSKLTGQPAERFRGLSPNLALDLVKLQQEQQKGTQEAAARTATARDLMSAFDLETIPGIVDTLSQQKPSEARQLAKQLSSRRKTKKQEKQTTSALNILSKAVPNLTGTTKLLAQAGIAENKPGLVANAIIQEGKTKPDSIPGILAASQEGLADLSSEETRKPYWIAAARGNIERADALEELYKQSVEKAPKETRSFWEKYLPNVFGGKPSPENTVTVISPEGVRGTIPASQVTEAVQQGYRVVPKGQ